MTIEIANDIHEKFEHMKFIMPYCSKNNTDTSLACFCMNYAHTSLYTVTTDLAKYISRKDIQPKPISRLSMSNVNT